LKGGEKTMMDMNDMMDQCMDMMGSMMGGPMMGNGVMLVFLLILFLVWVIGLAAVGALIFWGVRRLSRTSPANG
jgi:hypothetical protein